METRLKLKLLCLSMVLALTGCDEEAKKPSSTNVAIRTSVDNCSARSDVPNCHFENGIYILKIGSSVTDAQQQRVKAQISDFINRSHQDVQTLLSNKRIVIGLTETEPDASNPSPSDDFILALADSVNQAKGMPKVLDGIELVYTKIKSSGSAEIDETLKLAAYQKLIQLFDYYVDENNNSAAGAELASAYNQFLQILETQANQGYSEHLTYNQCNYGNGQLPVDTCPRDPDDDPDGSGNRDPIHTLAANLNMGALMGMTHDYIKDPSKNSVGELEGSKGSAFSNSGTIGTGAADSISWSNPAFKPLANYINKWFLTK